MKILRNKKSIIITFAVIVGLIVVGIVVNNLNKKVEGYDKYSSTISIVTVSESGENHRIIEYETESDIIKIQANFLDMDTYYKENKLLFINADEKKIYEYETGYSYKEIYDLIKNVKLGKKVSKTEEKTTYKCTISKEILTKILYNLYLYDEAPESVEASIEIKDKKISKINFDLENVGKFSEVGISIEYKELNAEYEINTDTLDGTNQTSTSSKGESGNSASRPNKNNSYTNEKSDKNYLEITD